MNVLIIGTGGREAALAWKLGQSALAPKIYMEQGNAGLEAYADCQPLGDDVVAFCADKKIDFVVVGPEAPLLDGVGDRLRAAGIKVFAPSAKAAQLEGSKTFTRKLCAEFGIPSPRWRAFDKADEALKYIAQELFPLVIKADGLAAGKGVVIAQDAQQARAAIDDVFAGKFGTPSLLVEEFMEGEEASFFVLTDGKTAKPFGSAQDHKRAFDNDKGPNTGGMGAFSPAVIITPDLEQQVMTKIIEPTLAAMRAKGIPFCGVLYAGLMINKGEAKLVEFNVRFGDPECQILMMRLESDLLAHLLACADGRLAGEEIAWKKEHGALVVMAARGYPAHYEKGSEIRGLKKFDFAKAQARGRAGGAGEADVRIFSAAILEKNGVYLSNGGRVLNVAALGKTLPLACAKAYEAIESIDWQGGFYRTDIGKRYTGKRYIGGKNDGDS